MSWNWRLPSFVGGGAWGRALFPKRYSNETKPHSSDVQAKMDYWHKNIKRIRFREASTLSMIS